MCEDSDPWKELILENYDKSKPTGEISQRTPPKSPATPERKESPDKPETREK